MRKKMTNLSKKKALAAKALKVGKNRVVLSSEAIEEIKQAITKQDIKDLIKEGIISVRPVKGRRKVKKRKTKRGAGKIKKKVKKRKQEYVKITRKLRKYLMQLRNKGLVDRELYWELRKKIRMRAFKSKAHFKDHLRNIRVEVDGVEKKIKPKKSKVDEKKVKQVSKSKSAEQASSSSSVSVNNKKKIKKIKK